MFNERDYSNTHASYLHIGTILSGEVFVTDTSVIGFIYALGDAFTVHAKVVGLARVVQAALVAAFSFDVLACASVGTG